MVFFQILFKIATALLVLLALGIVLMGRERVLTIAFGPVTYTPIDFRTLKRTPRPNQYLVCPPDLCTAETDAISPVYNVADTVLKKAWFAMMAEQPRTVQVGNSPDASQYDFVQRSKVFRFPDTITVKFIALPTNQSTLAIYSRSHYGHSDLGVNRKRIEGWLNRLDQYLAAHAR
jgi:uncharacterized protein (DUF1499 family)